MILTKSISWFVEAFFNSKISAIFDYTAVFPAIRKKWQEKAFVHP